MKRLIYASETASHVKTQVPELIKPELQARAPHTADVPQCHKCALKLNE